MRRPVVGAGVRPPTIGVHACSDLRPVRRRRSARGPRGRRPARGTGHRPRAHSATSINPVDYKIREGYLQGAYPHHLPVIPGWDVPGSSRPSGPRCEPASRSVTRSTATCAATTSPSAPPPSWSRAGAHGRSEARLSQRRGVGHVAPRRHDGLPGSGRGARGPGRERVLIHAASGGVGHLAVQIAKALGATVVATGSPASHDWLRELGADEVLDYGAGPISEQLASVGGQVDAVLDLSAVSPRDAPHQLLAARGSSRSSTPTPCCPGWHLRVRASRPRRPRPARRAGRSGSLTVTVARTFALDDIVEAYRFAETGHPRGKVHRHDLSRSTTVGAIARNALPRWEIPSLSSGVSSAGQEPDLLVGARTARRSRSRRCPAAPGSPARASRRSDDRSSPSGWQNATAQRNSAPRRSSGTSASWSSSSWLLRSSLLGRPGPARRQHPRHPVERVDAEPAVVGQRRQPGRGDAGPRLQQGVALERRLVLDRLVVRRHVVEAERPRCPGRCSSRIRSHLLDLLGVAGGQEDLAAASATGERLLLDPGQVGAALLGQREQRVELGAVEGRTLGGALHLDEAARRRSSRRSCRSRRGRPPRRAGRAAGRRR